MNKDLLKQAQLYYQQGQLKEALDCYQSILHESNDDQPNILHNIAIIHAQMSDNDKALISINKALALQADNALFYNSKGNILQRLKKFDDAIEAYHKAIRFDPKYALAHNNIGVCLYKQLKFDKAKIAYQTAIKLNHNYIDAYYNYGILLTKLGDFKNAINKFKKTIELKPDYANAYSQLGEIYLQQQQYDQAIDYFTKQLQLNDQSANTWHSLGQAYIAKKNYDNAIKALKNALTLNPNIESGNHELATAFLLAGQQQEAMHYYMRQIQQQPLSKSYYNVGVLMMYKERNKDAIEYLQQAVKLEPDYLPTHINLGALFLKLDNISLAIQHYKKSLQLKPDDAEIRHILLALTQSETPESAPNEYLQHLFDQYATFYDKHLCQYLNYKLPGAIYEMVNAYSPLSRASLKIIDLGCGTGLCGQQFHHSAKQLIGIDISKEMIEQSKKKAVYDELKIADVKQAIKEYQDVDLVIAADVFAYIGELDKLLHDIYGAIKPSGLLIFSVEKTQTQPYTLQKSIRYAHSKAYLETLIEKQHFIQIQLENIIIRTQQKKPVEGYLVLLQKPPQKSMTT